MDFIYLQTAFIIQFCLHLTIGPTKDLTIALLVENGLCTLPFRFLLVFSRGFCPE